MIIYIQFDLSQKVEKRYLGIIIRISCSVLEIKNNKQIKNYLLCLFF